MAARVRCAGSKLRFMITTRHPELEQKVLRAIGSGVKRTQAALPRATGNGSLFKDATASATEEVNS